jgi:WD40 repeat protein
LLENGHVFTALNFTLDGKSLVTVDHEGVLRVWNTTTWSPPQTVEFGRRATAMDLSPDGRTLAIGFGWSLSNNQGIITWDLVTGSERQNLKAERPMGIAFSSDGKTLASTSERHDVVLWDVRSGRQLRRLHGHTTMLFGVAFSKDGSKLATSDSDGTLRIWEAASREQIDRDPQTLRAMYRLGTTRNQERRFADAKATLVRTLLLQQKWLPEDDKDIAKTRAQIAVAVEGLKELGLAETAEHPPPPDDSTPASAEVRR